MSGFDTDPFVLWSLRIGVVLMLALAVAMMVRIIVATISGRLDFADVVCGPSGRMSWKKLFGITASGVVLMAVLRDAADGTLSWELVAVVLGAAGLIDLGAGGLNVWEKIGTTKARQTETPK
jgi:hypothetical protein